MGLGSQYQSWKVNTGVGRSIPGLGDQYRGWEINTGVGKSNLAFCYKNGDGVPKDMKEAVRYFQLAADQNFAPANEALKNPIFASFV